MLEASVADTPGPEAEGRGFAAGEILVDATLDVRGLWCPLPPLRTVKALTGMRSGEILEVLGTNPVGNKMAPWVAGKLGNQLLGAVEDEAGFRRFYFRKA